MRAPAARILAKPHAGVNAMTVAEVFWRIAAVLNQADIPSMITGSFASAYYGVPRATQGIDILASQTADQRRTFVDLLGGDEH